MTSNTPSNPPSSRPMTLRQQLADLWYEKCPPIWKRSDFTDSVVELADRYCQEIAREARLDELANTVVAQGSFGPDFSYSKDRKGIVVIGKTELDERIAELTQKPPQPTQENSDV